jgi:hypothetical protein
VLNTPREKLIKAIVSADLRGIYDESLGVAEDVHAHDLGVLRALDIRDDFSKGKKVLSKLLVSVDSWIDIIEEMSKGAKKLGKTASLLRRLGHGKANKGVG